MTERPITVLNESVTPAENQATQSGDVPLLPATGLRFDDGTTATTAENVGPTNLDNVLLIGNTTSRDIISTGNITAAATSFESLTVEGPNTAFLERTHTTTNLALRVLQLHAVSSGDMVDGFGSQLQFSIEDTAAVENLIASIDAIRDGADDAGALRFMVGTDALVEGMLIGQAGKVTCTAPLGGLGYGTGAGGAATQITSKATGVTLNNVCGAITTHNASLAANTAVSFTLTNSAIEATDVIHPSIKSGATAGSYNIIVDAVGAGSCQITIHNYSGGALGEALVINFAVIKAVAA